MSVPERVRAAVLADARRNGNEVAEIVEGESTNGEPPNDQARPMWYGVDEHGEPVTAGYTK